MSSDDLSLNWDPAPEEELDLDALLSGDAGRVPGALWPLARVLAALDAAPASAELDGEASARAAFLRYLPPDEHGLVPAVGLADDVRALLPPPGTADGRPRPYRRRRRLPARGHRKAIALLGSAAAVVVGFAAFAGAFSGHGGQTGQPGRYLSATATAELGGSTKSPVLEGRATAEPTVRPKPTPTPSGTGQQATGPAATSATSATQELCREYLLFLGHPGPAEIRIVRQLIALAGTAVNVPVYCSAPFGREPQIPPPSAAGGGPPGPPPPSGPHDSGSRPDAPAASGPVDTGSQPSAPGNSAPGNSAPGNSAPGNSAPGGHPQVRAARTAR
jgi:hypothetical protein